MPAASSLRLALFYIAIFLVLGVQVPFWPVWLAGRGLTPEEIGALLAVGQWVKVPASPLAGMAADRSGEPRRVMLLLSFGAAAAFALCLPAQGFAFLVLLSASAGACLAALMPLADAVTLGAAYAGNLDYGRVRLWGSLAFIPMALLAGRLLQGAATDIVLYLIIACAALTFAACLGLPRRSTSLRRGHSAGWRQVLTPPFLIFLGASTLVQGSHGVFYAFSALHWQSIGLAETTVALLWTEGVVAEILLFYWGGSFLRWIGPLGLVALGGGAGLVRWTATAFAASLPLLALVQLLHAFTFAAAHLGAMHHLARTVPAGHALTGQSLYTAIVGGVGPGLILLAAGALYGVAGGLAYLAMAALAGAGALVALRLRASAS
jgi:MFS transporter, PPP family, 3-phenylpropionic acid transporter